MRLGSVLSAFAVALCLAHASASEEAITDAVTMQRDYVREVRLGTHVMYFEKSPLEEIRRLVGAGTIVHRGDAGESTSSLCYSLPGELVWFVSTPLGGTDHALMEVSAEAATESDPRRAVCPSIPVELRPVTLPFGWVGTSESTLHAGLGNPAGARGQRQEFTYVGKERGELRGETVEFDVLAYVRVELEAGRVTFIRASHMTTY